MLIAIFFTLLFSSQLIAQSEETQAVYYQTGRWKKITREFIWDEPEPVEILVTFAYYILSILYPRKACRYYFKNESLEQVKNYLE